MPQPTVTQDVITGRFTAWSRDPEFPHCYGTGDSEEMALMSYKLMRNVLVRRAA